MPTRRRLTWRGIWFVEMLGFYLIVGRMLPIPVVTGGGLGLIVFAVLGFRSAVKFWILSDVLDFRWWNGQLLQFYGFILPVYFKIRDILALEKAGDIAGVKAQLAGLNSTLSWLPKGNAPGPLPLPVTSILLAAELSLIPVMIWLTWRRIQKVRRRVRPVIHKLPS